MLVHVSKIVDKTVLFLTLLGPSINLPPKILYIQGSPNPSDMIVLTIYQIVNFQIISVESFISAISKVMLKKIEFINIYLYFTVTFYPGNSVFKNEFSNILHIICFVILKGIDVN